MAYCAMATNAAPRSLRNGGPASVRRAIGWYRTRDRLHAGDAMAMADEHRRLQADTTSVRSAVRLRHHRNGRCAQQRFADIVDAGAATVAGAHRHHIAVGDLVLSRHKTPGVTVHAAVTVGAGRIRCVTVSAGGWSQLTPRRMGEPHNDSMMAPRCIWWGVSARACRLGYAVTVHTSQGVTVGTTHAMLGRTATRAMLTSLFHGPRRQHRLRLRSATTEFESRHAPPEAAHVTQRGSSQLAGQLVRSIVANDERPITAHDIAMATGDDYSVPVRVRGARERRAAGIYSRVADYQHWRAAVDTFATAMRQARGRDVGLSRSADHGIEL